MTYDILQSSTQSALLFLMVQSSDHITGLTGASPTVTISKNGAAFGAVSGAVTEISSGWYKVAGNATDTGTLGPLALHATAASGDPTDILVANIVSYNPQSATNLGLSGIPTASPGAANGIFIAGANVATSIAGTAASGATPAVAALTLTGGAASTTGGGVASSGLLVTGGAGAASTNGAIDAATFLAGGTNTVASTASGIKTTGTSTGHGILATSGGGATGDGIKAISAATAGNGLTAAHSGSAVYDFNATTTPLTLAKTTNITGFNDITAAAAATGVWQDTTAGDFTVSASVGKSLMNGVSLGTGLKIAECVLTDTVTTVTNQLTAAAIATGIWQDTTSGDFTVSSSIGKSLYTTGAVPGATGGLFIAGTNAATSITTALTANITGNLSGSVGSVTGAVGSVTGAVGSVTAQVSANVTDWNGTAPTSTVPPDAIFIRSGTAQAGGSSTITLDSGASSTNNLYQNEIIFIRSGTGVGQSNIIASYVGSTKVATVATAWATNPDNTSVFSIIAQGPSIASVSGTVNANVVSINSVSASGVTTVAAVQGTTVAPLFDSNTCIKSDLVDIAGSAVSATTAQLGVNVVNWNNTVVATPATAGIPEVDVKNINNVSASSVTTINANQGTTQPVNFSGTGSSAYVKADTEQLNAQAVTAAAGVTFPASVASPTNITAGTITTVTNLTNAATAGDLTATMKTSVTTAATAATPIASSVSGNVAGSVGSVVAAVGITSNRKKGATATFEILMQDATTGAPKIGLTPASTISKDGGAPASTANSITEIGLGQYQIVLTAGEMTANNVFLQATAAGAITFNLSIQTAP